MRKELCLQNISLVTLTLVREIKLKVWKEFRTKPTFVLHNFYFYIHINAIMFIFLFTLKQNAL